MTEIEKLLAIEEIKQVKAKYFYGFDTKNWDMWRDEVWAPEGRMEIPEYRAEPFEPFEEMLAFAAGSVEDQVSVHHGHMPIIDFVSDTEAKVIWAMEDRLYRTREHPLHDGTHYLHGFGHYHETYVKRAVGWRLLATRLVRLRVESRKII